MGRRDFENDRLSKRPRSMAEQQVLLEEALERIERLEKDVNELRRLTVYPTKTERTPKKAKPDGARVGKIPSALIIAILYLTGVAIGIVILLTAIK